MKISHPNFEYFVPLFFYGLMVVIYIILLFHSTYFSLPNSDFFAYLSQGENFFSHPLTSGKHPIGYPVLIYVFEQFRFIQYAGIRGGIFLNICSFIASLVVLFHILRRQLQYLVFAPILLLLLNPLSYGVVLGCTNESVFILCVLVVWLLRVQNNRRWAYAAAFFSLLFRHEGIVMIPVLFVCDYMEKKKIYPYVVLYSWLLLFLSTLSLLTGNAYGGEIQSRLREIPNTVFLFNTLFLLPFHWSVSSPVLLMVVLCLFFLGIWLSITEKNIRMIFGSLFLLLYFLMHVFFPDASFRYSYIALWFLYPVFLWMIIDFIRLVVRPVFLQKITYICVAIGICWIGYTMVSLLIKNPVYPFDRQYDEEKKYVAEWLDVHTLSPTTVYVIGPWIVDYFVRNPLVHVSFDTLSPSLLQQKRKDNLIIVIDPYIFREEGYFFNKYGGEFYRTFSTQFSDFGFRFLDTIYINKDHWAKLYGRGM